MRNTVVGRILMYFAVWVVLFLILCVVSIAKNWDVLVAVISGTISSLVGYLVMIGLMIYGIGEYFLHSCIGVVKKNDLPPPCFRLCRSFL